MAKTTYTATFSDGSTLTRKSVRSFTHAYRVIEPKHNQVWFGFSNGSDRARNAAMVAFPNSLRAAQTIEIVPAIAA